MANSCDWIASFQDGAKAEPPAWIAALGEQTEFREGAPFSTASRVASIAALPESEESESEDESALADAYARGEAAGRLAAETEAKAEFDRLRTVRLAFQALDQVAMDSLASELRDTVIALCEQVIGDLQPDPDTVLERARQAAKRLGEASGKLSLRLNPADIDALGDTSLQGWQVTPDPSISRGGLILESVDGAVHDGPDEWRRAIAEAVRG